MSWRVVAVTGNAKVDYKMDYLVVRMLEEVRRVHVSEIGVLILESTSISITAYALSELIARKVKIIFCDKQRNPQSELLPLSGSHDSTEKIRRQMAWPVDTKQAVWTEIIREKIKNQRAVLIKWNRPQAELLSQYLLELKFGDESNREGHAAKVYFNALFGNDFYRDQNVPINAALNYGYSLLLSAVNREISAAGYLTQLGIFHDNTYNAFNLGCDLMEPLRPIVDHAVMKMQPQVFEKEEKRTLVQLLHTDVSYDGRKQVLLYALRLYCAGIFRSLNTGEMEQLKMIDYEL